MKSEQVNIPTPVPPEAVEALQRWIDRLKIKRPKELVLINPQLVPEDIFDPRVAGNRGYYAYPPLGLLYVASAARQVLPDLEVKVVDLNFEMLRRGPEPGFHYDVWKDVLAEVLDACEAPHVGVTYMFGATKPVFLQICHWIRDRYPDAPLIVGGVQATYDYEELLRDGICELVFRRESEVPYRAFLEACVTGEVKEAPVGAALMEAGTLHELGSAKGEAPVDTDLRPLYHLVPIEHYHEVGSLAAFSRFNGADKPFATVLSNRGCRAQCTFCTVRDFNGFGVRGRPVQSVIDEIKYLVRERGIQQIDWLDDDLLWDGKRAEALFRGLAEQVPELEWICNNGLIAAAITEDIMYWMVQSGLKAFKIGIESGNDEMLHHIRKPTTKVKLRVKRELFRKYPDVLVSANFIIGFPNETFGQMMDTYDFAEELEWDWASMYICQPLKGTETFRAFQALGDERTKAEGYGKTLNPGRAAPRGEFGTYFDGKEVVATGWDVFKLPRDVVPSQEQLKEIWFSMNLVANFLHNLNFKPGGRPDKIVRWFESIADSYPYDASMVAGLARGHRMLGNRAKYEQHRRRFHEIVDGSAYWQQRLQQFPELVDFVEGELPIERPSIAV